MRKLKSLQTKFVRTLLSVTLFIGGATLAIVVSLSAQASSRHLASVQRYLEEGITGKGRVIAGSHARGLTLDNAFLDKQRLVDRTTNEDPEVVYGIYIGSEGQTLAYARVGARPLATEAPAPAAWKELSLSQNHLMVQKAGVSKVLRLGQEVLECAAPVSGQLEVESVRGEGTRWIIRLPRSSADPGARTRRISGVAWSSESPPPRELARG